MNQEFRLNKKIDEMKNYLIEEIKLKWINE